MLTAEAPRPRATADGAGVAHGLRCLGDAPAPDDPHTCRRARVRRLAYGPIQPSHRAIATGLAYLGDGVLLLRATSPAKGLRLQFENVLDIVLFSAQSASYASIPIGLLLVVGGIMTFRAAGR